MASRMPGASAAVGQQQPRAPYLTPTDGRTHVEVYDVRVLRRACNRYRVGDACVIALNAAPMGKYVYVGINPLTLEPVVASRPDTGQSQVYLGPVERCGLDHQQLHAVGPNMSDKIPAALVNPPMALLRHGVLSRMGELMDLCANARDNDAAEESHEDPDRGTDAAVDDGREEGSDEEMDDAPDEDSYDDTEDDEEDDAEDDEEDDAEDDADVANDMKSSDTDSDLGPADMASKYKTELIQKVLLGAPPPIFDIEGAGAKGDHTLAVLSPAQLPWNQYTLNLYDIAEDSAFTNTVVHNALSMFKRWSLFATNATAVLSVFDVFPSTLACQAILEWIRITSDPERLLEPAIRELSDTGQLDRGQCAVPYVSMLEMIYGMPHYIRYHENHDLVWYTHPFRFIRRMMDTDQQLSLSMFKMDNYNSLKADERAMQQLFNPVFLTVKRFEILPCSWNGSAISRPSDMGSYGLRGRDPALFRATMIPHVKTIGLPHYQLTATHEMLPGIVRNAILEIRPDRLQLFQRLVIPKDWPRDDGSSSDGMKKVFRSEGEVREFTPDIGALQNVSGIFKTSLGDNVGTPNANPPWPRQWIFDGDKRYSTGVTYPSWSSLGITRRHVPSPGASGNVNVPTVTDGPRSTIGIIKDMLPTMAEAGPSFFATSSNVALKKSAAAYTTIHLAQSRDRLLKMDPDIKLKDIDFTPEHRLVHYKDATGTPAHAPHAPTKLGELQVDITIVEACQRGLEKLKMASNYDPLWAAVMPKPTRLKAEQTPRSHRHPAWEKLATRLDKIRRGVRPCTLDEFKSLVDIAFQSWDGDRRSVKQPLDRYNMFSSLPGPSRAHGSINQLNPDVYNCIRDYLGNDEAAHQRLSMIYSALNPLPETGHFSEWHYTALRLYGFPSGVEIDTSIWPKNLRALRNALASSDIESGYRDLVIEALQSVVDDLDIALPAEMEPFVMRKGGYEPWSRKAAESWETASDPGSLPRSCHP